MENTAASPRVKRTPIKKAVFKKRPALGVEDAHVVKKKRTTKVEQLSVPKRKSQKRKRKLILEDAVEIDEPVPASVVQPAVVPVVEGTTEDPDAVIEQILHQLDTVGATDDGEHPAPTTKESIPLFLLDVVLRDSLVYRSPSPRQETSASSSSDSPMHLNGDDIPLEENVNVQTTFPDATADLSPLLDDLKTSLSQRMDNAHSDILSILHTIERGLQNTLGHQNDYFRNLIQNARQEGQNQDDLQILRLNELNKTVMAQGVTTDTDSLAVRNRFNALDAKILLLDGQVAAIRSEQLEFQAKMAADLLSLSTHIGDLFDYIRGGDAKKGEGSSSRRPLPTPVNQCESSGIVIRTTEIISQTDIDTAQRDIMERMMRADRERDRERRERSLSRSGSYKRRRGY
ncbi:hypothetical protein F511_03867 [Dorcoceras hygrometricum]|nr:hypothetical protein F511_03867 [Dorcoceras hygrometricum]